MLTHPSLPFSGATPISRQHSALASLAIAPRRGLKTTQLLDIFDRAGEMGLDDHQIARLTGWPMSTVTSTRNGLVRAQLVEARSDVRAVSPYRHFTTIWRRRVQS